MPSTTVTVCKDSAVDLARRIGVLEGMLWLLLTHPERAAVIRERAEALGLALDDISSVLTATDHSSPLFEYLLGNAVPHSEAVAALKASRAASATAILLAVNHH